MTPPASVTCETELAQNAQRTPMRPVLVGLLATITSSVFVWIFFWVAVVDFSIVILRPLRRVTMEGYIQADKNPLRTKLEKFLAPDCNPEIFVVGSSLAMTGLACADSLVYNKPFPVLGSELHSHYQCAYLEDRILELTGKRHRVFNFSVSGCMASDAWAILDKCLDAKPSVKVTVIMMSPREVHDTAASHDATKSSVIKHLTVSFKPIDWRSIPTSQSALEHALSKSWQFFNQRSDYRMLLSRLACETFDRAADSQMAACGYKLHAQGRLKFNRKSPCANDVMSEEMKKEDAALAQGRFIPYDSQMLKVQFEYLERALKLCKSKNVVPIVVDMPLPATTLNFLPEQLKRDYSRTIRSVCNKEGATIVELQTSTAFNNNDFRDYIHPIGTGGKKVIDAVTESLSHNHAALAQLNL